MRVVAIRETLLYDDVGGFVGLFIYYFGWRRRGGREATGYKVDCVILSFFPDHNTAGSNKDSTFAQDGLRQAPLPRGSGYVLAQEDTGPNSNDARLVPGKPFTEPYPRAGSR